ncbi:stalk domain-containing protein [Paenibacillus sp. GCM10012306]|uniref:stalk domain-containing protein n=1 Tax=Paenibacillus sp. GCM10012306 TaxID=3317342 RepID=UPI003608C571
MKKLLSIMVAGLLALVMAIPAFAAEKPIEVYINGSKVPFTSGAPYLQNNSILVPFRVVFEKLGLKVLWDAKTETVTGTGKNLSISLKIGSKVAMVNGTATKLPLAPVAKAGTTYIPLRFIAEATGGTAVWNPSSRTVNIQASSSDPAAEAKTITEVIKLANQYHNEKNAEKYYSLIDPDSISDDSIADLKEQFKRYDQSTTIDSVEIIDLKADEATVYTTETNRRIGGTYFPDQKYEYLYTLVRLGGKWKISEVESQDSIVLLTREQGLKPATVPQDDSVAILNNLTQYFQFMNEKNAKKVLSTMTSNGEEIDDSLIGDLEEFFGAYDITYTPGVSNIFYYNAGEAAVYVESKVKEASSKVSFQSGTIYVLSKSTNGAWTIDTSYVVSNKQL